MTLYEVSAKATGMARHDYGSRFFVTLDGAQFPEWNNLFWVKARMLAKRLKKQRQKGVIRVFIYGPGEPQLLKEYCDGVKTVDRMDCLEHGLPFEPSQNRQGSRHYIGG